MGVTLSAGALVYRVGTASPTCRCERAFFASEAIPRQHPCQFLRSNSKRWSSRFSRGNCALYLSLRSLKNGMLLAIFQAEAISRKYPCQIFKSEHSDAKHRNASVGLSTFVQHSFGISGGLQGIQRYSYFCSPYEALMLVQIKSSGNRVPDCIEPVS